MQTIPITRLMIIAGAKYNISGRFTERCFIKKKEIVKDAVIKTTSQQKIIQRGAKFFRNLLGICFLI